MKLVQLEEYLQSRYTKQTVKAYKIVIEDYVSGFKQAEKAIYKDIVEYLGVLRNRYSNPKTINRILSGIKVYYDYLCYLEKRKDNPAKSIHLKDKISRDIQLQDLFTTEELEVLINQKERYNKLDYRNKVLMSLLVYQGLLPREVEALNVTDINLEQGTVYIKSTANTNSRELQLKPNQVLLFYQYITEIRTKLLKGNQTEKLVIAHTGNAFTVSDITSHIKHRYKGIYSPRRVNAKTIRQSVICNLLKQNNDLRIVQVFAGHKYPSTTERYKQNDVEALKSLLERHHPIK